MLHTSCMVQYCTAHKQVTAVARYRNCIVHDKETTASSLGLDSSAIVIGLLIV